MKPSRSHSATRCNTHTGGTLLGHTWEAAAHGHRYKKIAADPQAMDRLLVEVFLEAYAKPPREIWLDLDARWPPVR